MTKYPFEDAPFGAVSPCLAISKLHSYPFGDVLQLMDYAIHGRMPSELVLKTYQPQVPAHAKLLDDIARTAAYWKPIFYPTVFASN